MIYNQTRDNLLSKVIPKEIGDFNFNTKDSELKEQLTNIFDMIHNNIDEEKLAKWEINDFKNFKSQLSRLSIPTFKRSYSLLMYYLDFDKEDLEKELRMLDEKLELHIFDDERIPENIVETKIINGVEVKETKLVISYKPHIFSVSDLLKTFQTIDSKVSSYNRILFKKYFDINNFKTFKEKIEAVETILELLRNKDQDLINIIKKEYFGFVNSLENSHPVYSYLNNMTDAVIIGNKEAAEDTLVDLKNAAIKVNKSYAKESNHKYLNAEAKRKSKHAGYKFG